MADYIWSMNKRVNHLTMQHYSADPVSGTQINSANQSVFLEPILNIEWFKNSTGQVLGVQETMPVICPLFMSPTLDGLVERSWNLAAACCQLW